MKTMLDQEPSQVFLVLLARPRPSVSWLHQGRPPSLFGSISFIFMHFLWRNWPNNSFSCPPLELSPLANLWNPAISATDALRHGDSGDSSSNWIDSSFKFYDRSMCCCVEQWGPWVLLFHKHYSEHEETLWQQL